MLPGFAQQHTPTSSDPGIALSHIQPSHPLQGAEQDAVEPSPSPDQRSTTAGSLHGSDLHEPFPQFPVTPPPLQDQEPRGLASRVWHAIMSRSPLLLIRSSPALGTGSYGAVPLLESRSRSNSISEDEENGHLRPRSSKSRGKRVQSEHEPQSNHAHFADARRRFRSTEWPRTRRRHSSSASDIGMGLDSKTSFAVNGLIGEGKGESSPDSTPENATTDEDEEDEAAAEDDPPDNSPYPEVRASVPATDNASLSINTPRMWILSLFFAIAGSATNLFFSLRYPSVAITPVIALVLVHPMGKLWDLLLKRSSDSDEVFVSGTLQTKDSVFPQSRGQRIRSWLAQGRWNEKEHACVYISSNVSFGFAFATDVIVEQHKFYKQEVPILYQLLLTISTQILGYAFAGLTRRFLVRPAAMIWPGTLMSTAMFTTMHKDENKPANGWRISRYRFFIYVWAAAFAWYFLPGLLFPALSYFSVVTWFAPKNVVVSNLVSDFIPADFSTANHPSSVWLQAWVFSQ